jgi:predicted MFS family arabinose efflux permease
MATLPPVLRITLIGLVALALAMGIGRFAFTPMLPLMQDDGLLGVSAGGLLASCHFLGYLTGAMSAARVRLAPRVLLRLSLLLIGFATLGMGLTDSYAAWLMLRWVSGVCSAWVLVLVSNYYVKALAHHSRASDQGWVFSGVGAGVAVVGLGCLGFMLSGVESAPAWLALGLSSMAVAIALCLLMGDELPAVRPPPRLPAAQRTPLAWGLVLAYGIAGLGYTIPATYLPVMARETFASPMVFGWSWPVFGLAAFASTLLVARLQARYCNRRIWATGHVVMAVGLLLPVVLPHILAIAAAGLCVGGSFMVVTMVGMREAHRIAPPPDVMRHIAVMTTAFATGQVLGPMLASAWFAASGSLSGALVLTSTLLLASIFALVHPSLKRRWSRA